MAPYHPLLDTCTPAERDNLQLDLCAVAEAVALGISCSRADATSNTFALWDSFCRDMEFDPTLESYTDPVPVLQIFAHQYRLGIFAPSQAQVRGRTVGDAIRAIGHTLAGLGRPDPRLQPSGNLTSDSHANSHPTPGKTHRRLRSSQYRSQCYTRPPLSLA